MRRSPTSSYRVQLRDGLTLDGLAERGWLDHIAALGVSHLYLSPVLTARPGSAHGYDVADPTHVDPALGGDEAFDRLAERASALGLELVVDIVPNHMAADQTSNPWWWDVLRNGDRSEFAEVFDMDPAHPEPRLRDRIFLPVLDDRYGRVLDEGRFSIRRRDADLIVSVDERPFPLAPESLGSLLVPLAAELGDDLLSLVALSYERLGLDTAESRESQLRVLDALLSVRLAEHTATERLDEHLEALNHDVDRVHEVLEAQNYRLGYWRAERDLGYRRFFDVNELIGVRVETPRVFDLTHERIREWIDRGSIAGLRVDHPDGLSEPAAYFAQLRELMPDGWILAEKILEEGEELPAEWPIDGTTGYDVAEWIGRWFVHPDGLATLGLVRDELVGPAEDGASLVADCKRLVLGEMLAADLNRATQVFLRLCESQRRFRDVTRHEVHEVLREVVIAYPVYRTYVAEDQVAGSRDLGIIGATIAEVAREHPDLDDEVLSLLDQVLSGHLDTTVEGAAELRTRVEQLTGPAMAKGKEDTAFYRDVRLISRNEVGADPFASAMATDELHAELDRLQQTHPRTMTSLSTHDSKRSEDVRARLSVLAEMPGAWRALATDCMARMDHLDQDGLVDARTRYLLLQTLVGAFPIDADRLGDFALKAVREAKEQTSWIWPDAAYEAALLALVGALVADPEVVATIEQFVATIDPAGRSVSVAQKVLQLCAPGVPDLYWGSEDWAFRLVDPDNRHAPDLEALRELARIDESEPDPRGAAAKLHAVRSVLTLRARRPECFGAAGEHRPLVVEGPDADRVVAFMRGSGVVVVVARWMSRGAFDASTTVSLPEAASGRWETVLGGAAPDGPRVAVADLLGGWSAAVLEDR